MLEKLLGRGLMESRQMEGKQMEGKQLERRVRGEQLEMLMHS